MNTQELDAMCEDWAYWCRTRKYFAPPVPQNILAQMQPRTRAPREPDGPMSPDLSYLNMAIHGLADEDPEAAVCFSLYYFHEIKPVKTAAAALGIGRQTFYDRLNRFAERAFRMSQKLKRVHIEHTMQREEAVID